MFLTQVNYKSMGWKLPSGSFSSLAEFPVFQSHFAQFLAMVSPAEDETIDAVYKPLEGVMHS